MRCNIHIPLFGFPKPPHIVLKRIRELFPEVMVIRHDYPTSRDAVIEVPNEIFFALRNTLALDFYTILEPEKLPLSDLDPPASN